MSRTYEQFNPPLPEHHHAGPCDCTATAAYIRVSAVMGRDDHMISPEIQLQSIIDWSKRKGYRIVRVVPDIDKSGKTFAGRRVGEMVKEIGCQSPAYRHITFWKWSRWGRNLDQSLAWYDRVKAVGGDIDSATEDIDHKTAVGRLQRDLVLRVDQYQQEIIGENWRAAHNNRRLAGKPHSGRRRFGYDYVDRAFVINEDERPVVEGLYKDYVTGKSLRSLSARLNENGHQTTFGGPWTPQALGMMLDTGFAAGWIRERSEELKEKLKGSGKSVRNNLASFDEWRKGSHDPIIDDRLWEQYKKRRAEQAALPPRARTATHAFSSVLVCSECGRRLCTHYSGNYRTHHWVCSFGRQFHPGVAVCISNDKANAVLFSWVSERALPPDGESVHETSRREFEAAQKALRSRQQLNSAIAAEMAALERAFDLLARGLVAEEVYLRRKAGYEAKIVELRAELASLAASPDEEGRPSFEAFGTLATQWQTTSAQDLNAALRVVVGMVVVSPAGGKVNAGADPRSRTEVVGRWEMSSWEDWFEARRKRAFT